MPVNPTDDRDERARDRSAVTAHAVRAARTGEADRIDSADVGDADRGDIDRGDADRGDADRGDRDRGDRADRAAARHDGRPVEDGDIRARLQQLTIRQQRFERAVARRLEVDAAGLDAMDHLLSAGPSTPTELAHRLEISTAAMTLVLNRLESAGHVRRERHPSDGRKLVVTASEESAEEAHGRVAPLIEGVEELIASMGDADLAVVEGFLERLVQIYDDATPA